MKVSYDGNFSKMRPLGEPRYWKSCCARSEEDGWVCCMDPSPPVKPFLSGPRNGWLWKMAALMMSSGRVASMVDGQGACRACLFL